MGCVDKDLFCSKLTVILIGIGSAGLVVSIYHWITVVYCSRTRQEVVTRGDLMAENVSIENSTIQLIPAHSYKKGKNTAAAEEEEDRTCSICLCDFEEGEQVRSLPECSHYFHVPCIDMWLYAHSSCPMCRADATPPPSIFPGLVLQDDEDGRSRQETADLEHVLQVL